MTTILRVPTEDKEYRFEFADDAGLLVLERDDSDAIITTETDAVSLIVAPEGVSPVGLTITSAADGGHLVAVKIGDQLVFAQSLHGGRCALCGHSQGHDNADKS